VKPGDMVKWRKWESEKSRWRVCFGMLLDDVSEHAGKGIAITANTRTLTKHGLEVLHGQAIYLIDYNWAEWT